MWKISLILPFHYSQCEIPCHNVLHVLAYGLLDYATSHLPYFWLILLFVIALQIIYQLIWSNCIYKGIHHASRSASGDPLITLLCILHSKPAL